MNCACKIATLATIAVASLLGEPAKACEPARLEGDASALSEPWRAELRALLEASGDAAQAWGCSGATVGLELDDVSATLTVLRPGATLMRRPVATPNDVVPLGKAMLARSMPAPLPEPEPAEAPTSNLPAMPVEPASPPAPPSVRWGGPSADSVEDVVADDPPRAYLDAMTDFRYVGQTSVVMIGGGARAELPVGRWYGALSGRISTVAAEVNDKPREFEMDELALKGSLGYQPLVEPVAFRAGLYGALAVVSMEAEGTAPQDTGDVEPDGAVDGRVGAELRVAAPMSRTFSWMFGMEAEVAPASLANPDRRLDDLLPPMPGYAIGLHTGLEVAIR